ncbi:MAG: hypothetical protein LC130_25500 [Bryobacterales bacterium]|nr:hypothetical protein [Bryobacterales bacterium]
MSKRYTITVKRDSRIILRLRLPSVSAAFATARRLAEAGTSVKIRPAIGVPISTLTRA